MNTAICIKTNILILLLTVSIHAVAQSDKQLWDTIYLKETDWGIDEIFGTQNSYTRPVKAFEITAQEFDSAKKKTTIIKTYSGYYENLEAITDSFCIANNIKDLNSLKTHYLLSQQHLEKNGLSKHVRIDFSKRQTKYGFIEDSSHYLILLQATNNVMKQIQVNDGLYGFYFGEYFRDFNIFEINLTCEFGPMGELLFNTKEGYLYKTDGELIARTHDSLLLFVTNYRKYFPGPVILDNKVEFYDFNSSDLYCFNLDSIVSRLDRTSNFTKKEHEFFWGISDFAVVKTIQYYEELRVVYYEVFVQLSAVVYDEQDQYKIIGSKYYKTNPRDGIYSKK